MSKGATGTQTSHPSRTTSLAQQKAQSPKAQSRAAQQHVPASPSSASISRTASHTYLRNAQGLGISTPDQAPPFDRTTKADSPVPLHPQLDALSTHSSNHTLSEELLPSLRLRLDEARSLVKELNDRSELARGAPEAASEDGQSSIASSFKNFRTSVDSDTTVSTMPTTPRPRISITSEYSRSLSFKSPIGSTPSTPSQSRSPSPSQRTSSGKTSLVDLSGRQGTDPSAQCKKQHKRRAFSKRAGGTSIESERSQSSDDQADRKARGRPSLLRKRTPRSSTGLSKGSISENEAPASHASSAPAVPPLPISFSTEKLPTLRSPAVTSGRSTPVPRLLPPDRTPSNNLIIPKKKDELWSVFRALDADFAKFSAKSIAFKAGVVRTSLIPFLRAYATHPSNRALRPEDLDRRANILNKWWTGLIELLHGRNNQSISGTDRPAILDGISGIMDRPEWRLSPSPFCPLQQRTQECLSPSPLSKNSPASSTTDFLADSVHHNVRNIFVQNLSAQMAFVVDKMSLRNASASLVTFCGKACAYAFMFVPGMADVLVRLWDLRIEPLRRVLHGNGIGKFENVSDLADPILSVFPPALQQLGFSSLSKYMRTLRTPPQLPAGMSNIEWWGHWLERWRGRESDLFYVFVKHFHILASDFLPSNIHKKERMCAPGMLLVHAQILVNLDATIHRNDGGGKQDSAAAAAAAGQMSGFDDVLADPDAVASALPMPPVNATRLMAENRLIMLIRDFLSERSTDHPVARQHFAESFSNLLEICTTGTSLFDHAACYTLLDFLEEALVLLVRFERSKESRGSFIDFDFWKTVWKKMISSHNTMTEIRLYSFLYTVWNTVICESGWKAELCLDMLLDADTFHRCFNHWCPMVRAYFMRLLCWRVARQDDESSSIDVDVFKTLAERLGKIWSHYLFLRGLAELEGTAPPSTSPSYPVPSRRLRIVRTDGTVNAGGAFLSFDGLFPVRNAANAMPSAMQRNSTFFPPEPETRPTSSHSDREAEAEQQRGRSIGGFFRNLIPSKSRSKSRNASRAESRLDSSPPPPPPPTLPPTLPPTRLVRSATDDFHPQRASVAAASVAAAAATAAAADAAAPKPTGAEQPSQHRKFSFKFSLEYLQYAKPLPPMRLAPPRLPAPAQQFLAAYSSTHALSSAAAIRAVEPAGASAAHARYCGRALAEWTVVLGECQNFFERRRSEGVPANRLVETPTLAVEVFRRPS